MPTTCYAHSADNRPEACWQTLSDHAHTVGDMAAAFAAAFGAQEIARYTGELHDLGKYSPDFQARLRGSGKPVDHATAGAKIACERWGKIIGKMMAYCIAGHHAGLANGSGAGNNRRSLQERLALQFGADIPLPDDVWQQEIRLPPTLAAPPLKPDAHHPGFSRAFFIRMLYSCLVDADYLDTEAFYAAIEGTTIERGGYPALNDLQTHFRHYLANLCASAAQQSGANPAHAALNRLRREILDHATAQAAEAPGLFRLTVPTGGGKTFTSMSFALEHARQHGLRRIIYVIPFTSIIEQNAAAFRAAFAPLGAAVLEHHSTFDDSKLQKQDQSSKDKLRRASENWDAPVVVTTAVQFFESLFADRSARCRKLHNIAGSVIILDEAQMLPPNLLLPIMQAIKELAQNYRCSVVLCTATQPAVQAADGFYRGFENMREIAPEPEALFAQLRRTTVRHIGRQTDADLLAKLGEHPQILIIVNNRRQARSLYDAAAEQGLDGVFHLSTLMCAAHRRQTLESIRARLKNGESCRVIATSLIEAGVDVDFPLVMRAEAGLDSVAQAAGRCNREGKQAAENSPVWVFAPEEGWKNPPELAFQAEVMRVIARHHADDLLSTAAITAYFRELYTLKGRDLDEKGILQEHSKVRTSLDFPFQTIADKFRMIKSPMLPLLIPFNSKAEKLIEALRHADHIGGLLRELQPYTVQVYETDLAALYKERLIEPLNEQIFGKQFYALSGTLNVYDEAGLRMKDAGKMQAENCTW